MKVRHGNALHYYYARAIAFLTKWHPGSFIALKDTDVQLTRPTLLDRASLQTDEEAWEEFAGAYDGYIYNIACRMGLSHHDAEEVRQNAMLQLWKKLPEFKYDARKGRFRGWLCIVTGNEVKMLLRRRSHDADRLPATEREQLRQAIETAQSGSIEDLAEREWVSYLTALAWSRLQEKVGEKERAVFEMVSKGTPVEQVAEELHIATSSVYVYKKRVKDLLTQEIMVLNRELD